MAIVSSKAVASLIVDAFFSGSFHLPTSEKVRPASLAVNTRTVSTA